MNKTKQTLHKIAKTHNWSTTELTDQINKHLSKPLTLPTIRSYWYGQRQPRYEQEFLKHIQPLTKPPTKPNTKTTKLRITTNQQPQSISSTHTNPSIITLSTNNQLIQKAPNTIWRKHQPNPQLFDTLTQLLKTDTNNYFTFTTKTQPIK